MKTLIIAEAGVNHNGDPGLAYKLCDAAKEAGADVVKFQTWKTEALITKSVAQAEYQAENTGVRESQFDMLKRLELSYDDFRAIKSYCDKIGLIFASTADEDESLDFVCSLEVPFIKIGSGEICNLPYLRHAGSKKKPVILSTGMSSLSDVDISIGALKKGGASDITLLHCTTSYPCEALDVNLKAMLTLREAFKLPAGYSDHTLGNEAAISAIALGAVVIEKHFTLDKRMEGPDHKASADPHELKSLVDSVRRTEALLGTGIKVPTRDEISVSGVVRKRVVACRDIKKGEMFTRENITVKRNDTGQPAADYYEILGQKAPGDFKEDEGISFFGI